MSLDPPTRVEISERLRIRIFEFFVSFLTTAALAYLPLTYWAYRRNEDITEYFGTYTSFLLSSYPLVIVVALLLAAFQVLLYLRAMIRHPSGFSGAFSILRSGLRSFIQNPTPKPAEWFTLIHVLSTVILLISTWKWDPEEVSLLFAARYPLFIFTLFLTVGLFQIKDEELDLNAV